MIVSHIPFAPKYGIRVISGIQWLRNFTENSQDWQNYKQKVLEKISINVVNEIQILMSSDIFNKMSQRSLDSVKFSIQKDKAIVYIDPSVAQYLVYHEYGVKPQSMNWLLGKTIPFIIRDGKFTYAGVGSQEGLVISDLGTKLSRKFENRLIISPSDVQFRRVTQASLDRGSWFHPGIKPKKFFLNGIRFGLKKTSLEIPSLSFKLEILNMLEE